MRWEHLRRMVLLARLRVCSNAKWENVSLCFLIVKDPWIELCHVWSRELAAMVVALKLWLHYLYSSKFMVFTNHKSFKYIFTQSVLNLRQWRWMEYLKDYNFQLFCHLGKANVVANAISWQGKVDKGQQMAHLWAMSAIVINIDKMYHVIGLLENLVISNDLAD